MNEKLMQRLGWLGVVSLLSYAAAVVFSPLAYPGYDWLSQAVSDLSADSAPSRVLWNRLAALYAPCGIVCVTLCCVSVRGHFNRIVRMGIYLFALMNWISTVGYAMFPLTQAGISGQFQDVMHMIVTAAVVLLSIASLALIACGALRQRTCPALGTWALVSLGLMAAGAVGTAVIPHAYFGVPERFSVFACTGFTAVLGLFHRRGWEKNGGNDMKQKLSNRTKAAMAEQTVQHALRGIQEAIAPDNILPAADRETRLPGNHVLVQYGGSEKKHAGRLFVLRKKG